MRGLRNPRSKHGADGGLAATVAFRPLDGSRPRTSDEPRRLVTFALVVLGALCLAILLLIVAYSIELALAADSGAAIAAEASHPGDGMQALFDEAPAHTGGSSIAEEDALESGAGRQGVGSDQPESSYIELPQSQSDSAVEALLPPTPTAVPRHGDGTSGYRVEGVPAGVQERNLSCELQSAADLSHFYGYPLSWQSIFVAVGHDPNGNPHVGFVGNSLSDSPLSLYPDGYGVYAGPVARGLQDLGLNAFAYYNMGAEWLRHEIRSGRPVIVWATFDMAAAEPTGWYTADGKTWVRAVRGEHTFTVVGYDDNGIYANDPWYGRERFFSWTAFLLAWDCLGQMALSIQPVTLK